MVDIRHESYCAAPVQVAFAYVDDIANTTEWMFGLQSIKHVRGAEHGVGAIYDGSFHVKPIKLSSTVEVTAWEQDALIALRSVKGFANQSRWQFTAEGPERTRIDVVFSYQLPGGLAGKAMGRALEPIVGLSVRHSDEALRRNIEAIYADQQG